MKHQDGPPVEPLGRRRLGAFRGIAV